jgi:type I restriction enzyme, S subunit
MRLQAYKDYKATNDEWLGDVPKHWNTKRLKMSAGLKDRKVQADPDEPMPYIGLENIESWTGRLLPIDNTVIPAGTANAFNKKHTLFGKLRPYLAKACNPKFDGLCSTELLVLQSVDLDRANLLYSLLSDGFIKLVDSSTFGSKMPRANWDFIGNCVVPIPPRNEQLAIADFLDRETARLDTLVKRKRELIEKLREKRTALISRTVTRGLNPNVKLKSSGVEWLGDVPEHWESGNLRRYALMRTGHTPSRNVSEYWEDCTIPWFTLADVWQLRDDRNRYLGETKEKISELGLANSAADLLPAGTVIFSRTASIGFSGIMPRPMATTQDFWNWICGPKLKPEYLLFLFRAMKQEFERLTSGSTHKTIYQPDAASLRICVPPIEEQDAIANYLDLETAKLDRLMEKVEAAIEKLQEYRTALITAAVTGKIDVRNCHG